MASGTESPTSYYIKQIRTVAFILTTIVLLGGAFAWATWGYFCNDSISSCFSDPQGVKPFKYILLGFIRPFTFFPATIFSIMGAQAFGDIGAAGFAGILLMTLGSITSFLLVYGIAKLIGKHIVNPWLSSNLPQTLKFIRSQDWKVTFGLRLVPIIPFDVLSFASGIFDFRFKQTLAATTLAAICESYIIVGLVDKESSIAGSLFTSMILLTASLAIPGLIYEWTMRKKGSGLPIRLSAMYKELIDELRLNNDIIKRYAYIESNQPVLLLYGFFSSRKTLSVMESLLRQRGYDVLSFNLGGLLGIFFTKGIVETARFINHRILRQLEKSSFDKLHIVAHSKGGLVALWWLLKMGGHRYCDKVVTMGSPFKGNRYTWLILMTPAGLFWKDIWEMRPGSAFLKALSNSYVPENLEIYCLHSNKDSVSRGRNSIYTPEVEGGGSVTPVPMNHISHFEFLYKRDVADTIARILGEPIQQTKDQKPDKHYQSKPSNEAC